MKKLYLYIIPILFASSSLFAKYNSSISPISTHIKKQMLKGKSWKKYCPVQIDNLRYLQMSYIDFQGKTKQGEMIVHKDIAFEVTEIFKELYKIGYPIYQMKLISAFNGSDFASIEADNTSAFNCRSVTANAKKWSNHSYGKAIDINPIENPYISRNYKISHRCSKSARYRKHSSSLAKDKAIIIKGDKALSIFKRYSWKWGGEWRTIKDYQHFEKTKN